MPRMLLGAALVTVGCLFWQRATGSAWPDVIVTIVLGGSMVRLWL